MHTPGHTMESTCWVLEENGKDECVFTGDTLFLGEVGRPDLAVKAGTITKQDLAGFLYDSLRNKIMKLDPEVVVFPAHGAGSPCGKKIADGTYCTIGKQLENNYALQEMTREAFIDDLTQNIPNPPQYFFHDVAYNKSKIAGVEQIIENSFKLKPLPTPAEIAKDSLILIDTRTPKEFEAGHIPHTINLPLTINYAIWAGTLFPATTKFFIIAQKGKEKESIIRLARIGYDNIVGVLAGGFEVYKHQGHTVQTLNHIAAKDLTSDMLIYDVRNTPELTHGHIDHVINIPLQEVNKLYLEGKLEDKFPKDKPFYLHCKTGARSAMACSIFEKYGYKNMINIDGGYEAISKENTVLNFIKP